MSRTAFCSCQLSRMRWMRVRADALDLLQERRALVDDLQRALAEDLDDLAGVVRADALDQAGAEILLDALGGVRRRAAQVVGLELLAVLAVADPGAGRLDVLAGDGARQVADDGDEAAPAARHDAQDGEARFGVVEGDALDGAGTAFSPCGHCNRTAVRMDASSGEPPA